MNGCLAEKSSKSAKRIHYITPRELLCGHVDINVVSFNIISFHLELRGTPGGSSVQTYNIKSLNLIFSPEINVGSLGANSFYFTFSICLHMSNLKCNVNILACYI